MAKHRTLLLASCLSLLLAGCGGGGGVGSTPTPTPSPPPSPTPTPTPVPTPTPTPTPSGTFNTSEYQRSNAAVAADALTAYNAGASGAGVKIAILDSGLTDALGEFTGRIDSASRDMAGSRGFTDGDTQDGHGTSVAAVAAAGRNNNVIMGVAYNATVLALRTDDPGSCAGTNGCQHFDSVLASGVDYARTNGARVINMSLGGDPVSATLRAAIGRATAAGIIVVVSAGNCGQVSTDCSVAETQPDGFAQVASTAEARGLVIIAGAHNANYVESSFSNPAGSFGQYYLTALGDRVLSFDHTGQTFLYSGTSYSAPAVAGAVALLAQAFPNLTATQIVNLLMTTATDAGAVGTDSVYGRGILNLTAAFQPQGSTSLAGSAVPVLLDNNGTLSPAMGDANATASGKAVILDSYARAYQLNIGGTIRRMAATLPLTGAISHDIRTTSLDFGKMSVAMRVAGTNSGVNGGMERWAGLDSLKFSGQPLARPFTLGGAFSFRLGSRTTAFASFGQAIDAAPARAASWLIANAPAESPGFDAHRDVALGIRHAIGSIVLTVTGEQGSALHLRPGEITPRYTTIASRVDRSFGALSLGIAAGMMREQSSVLGARFSSALGGGGASTATTDLDVGLALGKGWGVRGQWREAWTVADRGGALTRGRLTSNAFSFDVTHQGKVDRVGFRLAQPLRVASGVYRLNLPASYDYATSSTAYAVTNLDLAPHGRELDLEGNYGRGIGSAWIDANLFLRHDPGNIAALPDDVGAAVRVSLSF